MIHLRPITPQEFQAYRRFFVTDYGRELVDNEGITPEAARQRAEADLDQDFPGGVVLPGHRLWCIVPEGGSEVLGYLWVKTVAESTLFVMDFSMLPQHRGRGHGSAALAALDEVARREGRTLKLRVAQSNPRALALYRRAGYQITGYNMAKTVGSNPP